MKLTTQNLQIFLESKFEELTLIIKQNITKPPEKIARAVIERLDCSHLPLSLNLSNNISNE